MKKSPTIKELRAAYNFNIKKERIDKMAFYSEDKTRMYIDCIEDLISLKDIDIKIYNQNSRTEENYYKWEMGYLCAYDKNGMVSFNVSFPIDEYNYVYTDEYNYRMYK